MSGALVIARLTLREAVRRRVLALVALFTLGFLALHSYGVHELLVERAGETNDGFITDDRVVFGTALLGIASAVILFFGVVIAVFLTVGTIRGDAERGLLQALVVRPAGRTSVALGRLAGALAAAMAYVVVAYAAAVVLTDLIGDYRPERVVLPGLALVAAVAIVGCLALLGSSLLATTANGIVVFLLFMAGAAAGTFVELANAFEARTLEDATSALTWALPFEALYQDGLADLGRDGDTVLVIAGPFGSARDHGIELWVYAAAYATLAVGAALLRFRATDL